MNFLKYQACTRYHKIYDAYLDNPKWDFLEIQPQIVKLFKEAEVEDNAVAYVEHVGYGKVLGDAHVSVMANLGNTRADVVSSVTAMFHKAKGTYRSRMLDAINPAYWLEFVIFLPRSVFRYVGVSAESAVVKTIQVIYWLIAGIVGFLFGVFGDEINAYVKGILLNALGIK